MMRLLASAAAIALVGVLASPAWGAPFALTDSQLDSAAAAGLKFNITNRVADVPGVAPVTDPSLVNAWGLAQAPGTFLWVNNNGTDTSTLYQPDLSFAKVPLTVSVPGGPTGITFVGSGFNVTGPGGTFPSLFAFATESGTIQGWNLNADLTHAIVAVNDPSAIFKGLTLGAVGNAQRLFAADFAHGVVTVYDSNFTRVTAFTDPNLPAGFVPFNVQNLNGKLYVAFAFREPGSRDEVHGKGLGFVDVFDTQGNLLQRLVQHGKLNAPWGLAIAPKTFGDLAGALLVGNFGDGMIHAYDPNTGKFLGTLKDAKGGNVFIDGLWALRTGPQGTITFSSGPDGENHGIVGSIATALKGRWGADQVVPAAEMIMH